MDYYIQGNREKATEIKAAFERLGIDTNNYCIGNDCYIYYSSNGLLYFDDFSDTLLNVFKSHPGYKELGLSVKPMFKVEDWAIDKYITNCVFQITKILDNSYEITEKDGHVTSCLQCDIEDNSRLWRIEDAKDGDVLCTYECGEPKIVFILRGNPEGNYSVLSYYCYYNIMYPHFEPNAERGCLAPKREDVKPANKEQRNLLFAKIKEAGYHWDADKKELHKIIEPTFKVGDEIFRAARNEYFKIRGIEKDNDTVWYVTTRTRIADNDKRVGEIVRINAFYQNEYSIAPKPHYDISNFHAGMPVLVRDSNVGAWNYLLFSHYKKKWSDNFFAGGCSWT